MKRKIVTRSLTSAVSAVSSATARATTAAAVAAAGSASSVGSAVGAAAGSVQSGAARATGLVGGLAFTGGIAFEAAAKAKATAAGATSTLLRRQATDPTGAGGAGGAAGSELSGPRHSGSSSFGRLGHKEGEGGGRARRASSDAVPMDPSPPVAASHLRGLFPLARRRRSGSFDSGGSATPPPGGAPPFAHGVSGNQAPAVAEGEEVPGSVTSSAAIAALMEPDSTDSAETLRYSAGL